MSVELNREPLGELDTSTQVQNAIFKIAELGGKAKQALLEEALDSPLMVSVCKAAYDPFTTYGMKKLPDLALIERGHFARPFSKQTWELLDLLASRKLSGNAAKEAVEKELSLLNPQSAVLLSNIIKRDLRAGFTANSVNKAVPGAIFVFTCMLSHKYESKRIKSWPVVAEEKLDGVRCIGIYKKGETKFYSRTGKEFPNFESIGKNLTLYIESHAKIPSLGAHKVPLVFDGEVMTGEFNETVGDVHKKGVQAQTAVFHAFEMMSLEVFNGNPDFAKPASLPYSKRRATLESFLDGYSGADVRLTDLWMINDEEELFERNAAILAQGGEGVIVKPLDGTYEKKRSFNWLKIKAQDSVDCPIVGYEEGTGKYVDTLGALVVDYKGVLVSVSGMKDADRHEFWSNQDKYMGVLVEVEYHEETPDKSLRHPRFKRVRHDKPVEDGVGV